MKKFSQNACEESETTLIHKAVNGDSEALETLIVGVKDVIFNLSLRMFGTISDSEDASQDIIIKVITQLASFKQQSSFQT